MSTAYIQTNIDFQAMTIFRCEVSSHLATFSMHSCTSNHLIDSIVTRCAQIRNNCQSLNSFVSIERFWHVMQYMRFYCYVKERRVNSLNCENIKKYFAVHIYIYNQKTCQILYKLRLDLQIPGIEDKQRKHFRNSLFYAHVTKLIFPFIVVPFISGICSLCMVLNVFIIYLCAAVAKRQIFIT